MENRIDIYVNRGSEILPRALANCAESDISESNKDIIEAFITHLQATGRVGHLRCAKLCSQLTHVCWNSKRNLKTYTAKDAEYTISLFNGDSNLSSATQADYRRAIKQFFKWYKREDPRLEIDPILEPDKAEEPRIARKLYNFLEDVSTGYKQAKADPKTVLSEKDIQLVLEKGCRTPKEQAFISLLHESGCRAGEFLNITVEDITLREHHAEIQVDGKTGPRTIFVVRSLPHLLKWLDIRPSDSDYLWITESTNHKGMPLMHRSADKLVDTCFKRAKLQKRHNLHWFRHSRATILAPKMTAPMLCTSMGWSLSTKQIKTYCHLSVDDLRDVMYDLHGLESKEDNTEKPIKCICGTLNSPSERYCFKCFKPMNVATAIQDHSTEVKDIRLKEREILSTFKEYMNMLQDPKMKEMFEVWKRQGDSK